MIRFLRRNDIYIWFLFTFFYCFFYIIDLLNSDTYNIKSYYSFFNNVFVIINNYKFLSLLTSFIFNLIIANLLLNLCIEFLIIPGKNFMPAIFYYVITGIVKFFHYFHPFHISLILLILILKNIFSSNRITRFSMIFFDSGLLAGISFILYYPSWIFLIIIFTGLFIFRTFNWREWVTTILGFIVPLIFVYSYTFVFDKEIFSIINLFKSIYEEKIILSSLVSIFFIYSLILSFISLLTDVNKIYTLKIITRKTITLFIVLFICISTILLLFYLPEFSPLLLLLATINFLFIITFYFSICKINWLNNIILTIFILLPFIIYLLDNLKINFLNLLSF